MKDWASLIQAISALLSALLWPGIIVLALLLFQDQIRGLFPRIRRLKGPGGAAVELDPGKVVERLAIEVEKTQEEQAVVPPPPPPERPQAPGYLDEQESRIVDLETRDLPKTVAQVALQLEHSIRRLAGRLGVSSYAYASAPELVKALVARGVLAPSSQATFQDFWRVRNTLLHGTGREAAEVNARFVGVGFSLIRMIEAIPRASYKVIDLIPVFDTPDAQTARDDVRGIVLEAVEGTAKDKRVYPTTKRYTPGHLVTWEWNFNKIYDTMWYRGTKAQPLKAWDRSAEFVGEELPVEEQLRERIKALVAGRFGGYPLTDDERKVLERTLFEAGRNVEIEFDYQTVPSGDAWSLRFTPDLGAYGVLSDGRKSTLQQIADEHGRLVRYVRSWDEWRDLP